MESVKFWRENLAGIWPVEIWREVGVPSLRRKGLEVFIFRHNRRITEEVGYCRWDLQNDRKKAVLQIYKISQKQTHRTR